MGKYGRRSGIRNFYVGATGGYSAYRNRGSLARAARFNMNRSFTKTKTNRRRPTSGVGITNQYDRSLIYRKRRMGRFRKRRYKRFNKRVLNVSEKDLGSRTVVRNDYVPASTLMTAGAGNEHLRWYFMLYGNTSGTQYYNDLNEISQDTDLGTTGKAIFKSGIIDMTFRNISSRLIGSLNPPITLEVDVYEITVGVELGQTGRAQGLVGVFNEGGTDTATIPGQATSLSGNSRGWTPWDFPSALSEYRVKIWKKTKYFLSENQTFTYQFRDPKRHVIDRQMMSTPGEVQKGVSRYFYVVFKPTPGYSYSDITPDTYGLGVGVTRKYLYKINNSTQDYDMYNT